MPMSESVRETLKTAADTGEVIRIIYHGGSQPGTVREISPISVSDHELLARDLATSITKTFKLAKLELTDEGTETPEYNPTAAPAAEETHTIGEALAGKVPGLESMGWHVKLSGDAISVHRFFKNGKPRKMPDIELSYNECTLDVFIELDGTVKEEKRKSSRPYRLSSRNFASARTFGKMSGAVSAFLDETRALAPTNAT